MMSAILRGFDFPARDIDDQLRFCNPLLSFDEGETAQIFLARVLDWQYGGEDQARWLTHIDADEVESAVTLISGELQRIRCGEGVVLMGERFFAAAREAGIDPGRDRDVKFTALSEAGHRIALASTDSYGGFARQLTREAARIFDAEMSGMAGRKLSARGEAALFLLRKCGLTSSTDLAIRQLAAARITRQTDRYRRLLIRFALDLGDTEDDIHKRVGRHLEVARGSTVDRNGLVPEQPWREQIARSNITDGPKYGVLEGEYLSYPIHPQNTDPAPLCALVNYIDYSISKIYTGEFGIDNRQIYNPNSVGSGRKEEYFTAKSDLHMEFGSKKLPGFSRFDALQAL